MSPGPRLQTEVTYDGALLYPVHIVIELGNTAIEFDITEKEATNLANLAKSFILNTTIRITSKQNWDFDACWSASDQFEFLCYHRNMGTSIKININAKQALQLYDQIICAMSSAVQTKTNSQLHIPKETVLVEYKRGAKYPIRFCITVDGQMIDECITEIKASDLAHLAEDPSKHDINVEFVTEQNWKYRIYWLNPGIFRMAIKDMQSSFASAMNITDRTAYNLYEQIRDILCGPASNMKSKTTKECPDCHGTGRIPMLNWDVDCDCVRS